MYDPIIWNPGISLASIEKEVIIRAYRYYDKNKTITAQSLDITAKTLKTKLDQYEKDKINEQLELERKREQDRDFQQRSRGIKA